MSKLSWDNTGERLFETGVKQCVLYPQEKGGKYAIGVAWNGVTAVTESPSGAEASPLYADDIKYLNLMSTEEFGATIEAYMYPDEFKECNGEYEIADGVSIGQQKRKAFGLSYRTVIGNDTESNSYGYKLHIIYGAMAAPSEKSYSTINDSPEAMTLSWELSTTPVTVKNFEPTSLITIDSTKVDKAKLAALEAILYGKDPTVLSAQPDNWSTNYTDYYTKSGDKYIKVSGDSAPSWSEGTYYEASDARLPLPDEVASIMKTV